MPDVDPTPLDGRRLRRDRNRSAVVSALLELYREGDLSPSSERIAERAGISPRSLFRYFEDLDALVGAAVEAQQAHLAPLLDPAVTPATPLDDRVLGLVEHRTRLLEAMGPVGRVARSVAVNRPAVADELGRVRRLLRRQVADLFPAELAALGPDRAAPTLAALDVALSWEAHHLLTEDQGLSQTDAAAATVLAVRRLLGLEP